MKIKKVKRSLFKKIRTIVRRWWVKHKLLQRRRWDYEIELLNEKWIIKRIKDGQVPRRKELAECQARIKEIELFLQFFENKEK